MKTDFLASGNHFYSTGTYFSANPSFRLVKTSFLSTGNCVFLFQVFFYLWKIILKFGGSQILKTNHIPTRVHQFFRFFPYCKSVFFNILYPASANEFSACGNSVFLVGTILLLLEIIIKR